MNYELVSIKEINHLLELIFINYLTYKFEEIDKNIILIV